MKLLSDNEKGLKNLNFFKKLLLFSLFWGFSCIIWPIWLMPKNFSSKLFFFFILIVYIILNIFLLKLWIEGIRLKKHKFEFNLSDKSNITLISFYLIFILINLYLITLPITISDGASYVSRGVALYKITNTMLSEFTSLTFISWISIVAVIIIFFLRKKLINFLKPLKKHKKKLLVLFALALITISIFYFTTVNNLVYNSPLLIESGMLSSHLADDTQIGATSPFDILTSYIVREGPFNTIIETIMISLFGFKEWALRIPSLLFSLFAGFYVYRIILLFRDRKTALLASVMLLFIPGFFYFTHLSYKEPGLIFFICASSFYLLRYSKENLKNDLVIASFFVGAGYLYKDPILFFIPIFWASWLIHFMISEKSINIFNFLKKSKDKLIFTWFSFVPIIPWFISTLLWRKLYDGVLKISYLTPFSLIKYTLISMPYDVGWVLYFLFFIAFLYAIYRIINKNEILLTVTAITFIVINIVYAFGAPVWGAFQRWYIPSLFGVVIIISIFIGDILSRIAKSRTAYLTVIVICSIFTIQATLLTIENLGEQYLPFDKTFKYIKEKIPEDNNMLVTAGPNPYRFYIEKHNIKNEFDHTKWILPSEKQNMNNLYTYCKDNDISYILFPYPMPQQYYYVRTKNAPYLEMPNGTWLFEAVNPYLIIEMSKNENDYFNLIKTFELGRNKMFIFKVIE